jgi:hypothetical protein
VREITQGSPLQHSGIKICVSYIPHEHTLLAPLERVVQLRDYHVLGPDYLRSTQQRDSTG